MRRAACIMDLYPAFAVPADYRGPLAREFHDMVARKWLAGMCGGHCSPVAPERLPDLVRCHLSADWQIENGMSYRRRGFDHFHIIDWLLDKWVEIKRPFKPNPYASAGVTRTGRDSEAGSVGEADSTRSAESGDAQPLWGDN